VIYPVEISLSTICSMEEGWLIDSQKLTVTIEISSTNQLNQMQIKFFMLNLIVSRSSNYWERRWGVDIIPFININSRTLEENMMLCWRTNKLDSIEIDCASLQSLDHKFQCILGKNL
jgi:hypothetical protein